MHQSIKPPTSFWVIAALALLWNLMGIAAFAGDMMITPELIAAMPDGQRALYENMPSWTKLFYGIATIGGVLASIGLLMRKSWCIPLFILSLIGVVVQQVYTLLATDAISVMGAGVAGFGVLLIIICAYLVWYAKKSKSNFWIS